MNGNEAEFAAAESPDATDGENSGPPPAPEDAPDNTPGLEPLDGQGSGGGRPSKPRPGLHLVATPIGNARDITLRALDTLRGADLVLCEDTRVTSRLMQIHGLHKPLMPYHDHNAAKVRPEILHRLAQGAVIALVSDAGTPMISDPGYKLVAQAVAAGIAVTTLPGPSSVLAALTLAALPTDRFLFAGFLPPKTAARRAALEDLAVVGATLVFLESAQRLPDMLADAAAMLGPRPAAVARELTKLFEEVRRDPLDALARHYETAGPPKGEVVVVIGPPDAAAAPLESEVDRALLAELAHAGPSAAAAKVAAAFGLPRRQVYARAMALKDQP
ncbi:16S rRNA (cytidine(1402)-2'-O)-methyltransferase [Zavarzinia compransoris]|uniref:Ribosomal RNA small subunit methyltransferase I n=1 Tax=Zavarzinia compransoris TaxID=1264899 RepID=A0A317EA02_9PROT|nr:16S rRNA (cytidine(1402)-2'-O)-methyltransferase [Zavarzinia compransoris]PWR21965.1 16S rRNA (cytidine(1402)-2'-O)-methyltransferase [Zavarzinia compransoris]TDP47297.1 16S rRNA (cytidine1402-2'-O)-methyltransferase [Zavarzinia compransoris]